MGSGLVKRRLGDLQRQLAQARESLGVLEEQVAVWNDALDDARIRALVSETPLQSKEYEDLVHEYLVLFQTNFNISLSSLLSYPSPISFLSYPPLLSFLPLFLLFSFI